MPMVFWCSNDTSSCTDHNYFRNGGFFSSVVWEGGVGKLNEKFRKQFSLKSDSPDNVLPNFSRKCCMRPFVASESLRSNLSNILNAF